jgi:hypothetical protein
MSRILLSLIFSISASLAFAQAPIQQSATRLDACTNVGYATATSAQATLQINPPAGQYVYMCGFAFDVCNGGTAGTAQNNVTFTSTNIAGSPTWQYSFPAAINTCYTPLIREMLPSPLKSAVPGTQVQIQSPATDTNVTYTIRVPYYFAP